MVCLVALFRTLYLVLNENWKAYSSGKHRLAKPVRTGMIIYLSHREPIRYTKGCRGRWMGFPVEEGERCGVQDYSFQASGWRVTSTWMILIFLQQSFRLTLFLEIARTDATPWKRAERTQHIIPQSNKKVTAATLTSRTQTTASTRRNTILAV